MELACREIRRILTDTNDLHGWHIPNHIIEYESRVLAERLEQPHWRPEPSFAERYMQIRTPEQALALGNVCWFTRSVFPELLSRRGISEQYFVDMGQSCYDRVLRDCDSMTIKTMRDHFEFLCECTYTAIRHYGEFRSMWD